MKTKRAKIDPMITMINVVFLLIAFFLFGQLSKPAPISITLPLSTSEEGGASSESIYVDASGIIYFDQFQGEAAIKAAVNKQADFQILADMNAPANKVLNVWQRLHAKGLVINQVGVRK